MRKQRCKKCNAEKGKPHKSACVVGRYPSSYPDSTAYVWVSESSWGGGCSSTLDGGSSYSSDSGGNGGSCE